MAKKTQISNPYSTRGGGYDFEYLVGTYYLISMLKKSIPVIMICGSMRTTIGTKIIILLKILLNELNCSCVCYLFSIDYKYDSNSAKYYK